MKLLSFFLTLSFALAQNIKELSIGSEIPLSTQTLKEVSGSSISLKDAASGKKGLLVLFSCNTCPYVKLYENRIKKIIEFVNKNNIGIIVLNSNEAQRNDEDSFEAMKKYQTEHLPGVPYAVDEKSRLADAFGATRTPQAFLFDANGKLIYKGAIDDNVKDETQVKNAFLIKAMEALLAGKKPETQETKSIGCTIKRLE
ncbi:MAG: thioredoxin family protein [Bacteroidia bacterium]|nr:thioredoxin family protein [Bacteroidia bacterium]